MRGLRRRVFTLCVAGLAALGAVTPVSAVASVPSSGTVSATALLAQGPIDPGSMASAGRVASSVPAAEALARSTGSPVLVGSLASSSRMVVANPDGSFMEDLATQPRWGQIAASPGWAPVDLTLTASGTGFAPNVAGVPVWVSGGGTGPFASTSGPGWSYSERLLDAPTLPKATVRGATATFASVLPGIDLVVQATPLGFSERFVLRSAPPAGFRIRLRIDVSGGAVAATGATGGVQVLDGSGAQVAVSGSPLMWDAAPAAEEAPGLVGASLLGAGDSAELDLIPDAAYVTAPGRMWPVTVDPDISRPNGCSTGSCYDTRVDSGQYANTSFWTDPKIEVGDYSGTSTVNWTFLKFDTSALVGSTITAAALWLHENNSATCSARGTKVKELTSSFSSATTWNNPPTFSGTVWADQSFNAGFSSSCVAAWEQISTGGASGRTLEWPLPFGPRTLWVPSVLRA